MPKEVQSPGAGHFLVSEANSHRSRQRRTFAASQNIKAGEPYGVITSSGLATKLAPAATDGSQTAAGIAYADVDTGAATAVEVGIERDAEVASVRLVWPAGLTTQQQAAATTQLASLGIIVRG